MLGCRFSSCLRSCLFLRKPVSLYQSRHFFVARRNEARTYLYTFISVLQPRLHGLPPPIINESLADFRTWTVEAKEWAGRDIDEELRFIGEKCCAESVEDLLHISPGAANPSYFSHSLNWWISMYERAPYIANPPPRITIHPSQPSLPGLRKSLFFLTITPHLTHLNIHPLPHHPRRHTPHQHRLNHPPIPTPMPP